MRVLWILAPILVLAAAEPPSDFKPSGPPFILEVPAPSPTYSPQKQPQTTRSGYYSQSQQTSTLVPSYPPVPSRQRSFQGSYGAPSPTPAQQFHREASNNQYGLPIPSPTSYSPQIRSYYDTPKTTLQPPLQYQAQPTHTYGNYNEIPRTSYGIPDSSPPRSSYGAPNPTPSYGAPSSSPSPSYGIPEASPSYGIPDSSPSYGPPDPTPSYGPPPPTKIVKHISVFIAPDEPSYQKTRTIRIQGEQEKHVNIIFIKSPNPAPPPKHEIEIPAPPEQKTLVYVLSKNQEEPPEIKITQNANAPKPATPDVYFIRYRSAPKDRYGVPNSNTNSNSNSGSSRSEYGSYFNSVQNSEYSNPEPIMVNGPLPKDEVSNYAPKMDYKSYNFISKRETAKGEKGVVNLNVTDFRPYSYAPKLGYVQYQVKGY